MLIQRLQWAICLHWTIQLSFVVESIRFNLLVSWTYLGATTYHFHFVLMSLFWATHRKAHKQDMRITESSIQKHSGAAAKDNILPKLLVTIDSMWQELEIYFPISFVPVANTEELFSLLWKVFLFLYCSNYVSFSSQICSTVFQFWKCSPLPQ